MSKQHNPMRRTRSAFRHWSGLLWLPAAGVVVMFCTDVEIYAPRPAIEELQIGDTVAVFPGQGGPTLAGVRQITLSDDEGSVYVLDADPDNAVHRIGLDGTLLASFGGRGQGPGELSRPIAIHPDGAGGVWVLDRRRVTRFGPDGSVAETLAMTDRAAATFSPVGDGGIVIPAGQPMVPAAALLTRVSADGIDDIGNPDRVPSLLSGSRFGDRFLGWKLASLGDSDVAIVLNGPELRGWRARIREDARAIASLTELSVPKSVSEVVAEESRLSALPDARPSPLWRIGPAAGRLWVVSTGLPNGPVAFTIPLRDGEPPLQIPARPGFHDRDHRVRDVVVLPDRIFVARDTAIIIRTVVGAVPGGG